MPMHCQCGTQHTRHRLEVHASVEICEKLNSKRPFKEIGLHGQKEDAALKLVEKYVSL